MIQAKDLRIGNIYLFSGNSEGLFDYEDVPGILQLNDEYGFYVYFNGMSNEMLSSFRHEQIKPIPLTEEILDSCGFRHHDRSINFGTGDYDPKTFYYIFEGVDEFKQRIYKHGFLLGKFTDGIYYQENQRRRKGLKVHSLHQLQNLYHALTGDELTVNL